MDGLRDCTSKFYFMQISGMQNQHAEGYFDGRLPHVGEAVEIVCVGRDDDTGTIRLQLRVKE